MDDNLIKMEKERKDAILWNYGAVIVGLIFAVSNFVLGNPSLLVVGLIIMIAGLIVGSKKTQYFRRKFKEIFIRDLFKKEFDEDVYINWDGMDLIEIEDAFVIPVGNSNRSDDEIIFNYKDVKIRRSDVFTELVINSGKTTTRTKLFRGQYMIFSFHKKIKGFTVIKENKWIDSKPGGVLSGPKTEKIPTESVEFNKQFTVFSNEPHEVFYLLTPQFMEVLLNFQRYYNTDVYYGFMKNEFHVAIDSNENMFEPKLLTPVNEVSIKEYNNDIERIKEIVNQLNLIRED